MDTIHEEMSSARKEPNVPSVPEIIAQQSDLSQEGGSPDSAFLSAGSSTENQVILIANMEHMMMLYT